MAKFEKNEYETNEAWIVFRLTDTPVMTQADGDFHVIGLMDAASRYIFGTEFVAVDNTEATPLHAKQLLKTGQTQSSQLPRELIIHNKVEAQPFLKEAELLGINATREAGNEIWPIIQEAVEGFRRHISSGAGQ